MLTATLNRATRADFRRRAIRPARRGVCRVSWPRAASRLQADLRRQGLKCRNPSLTNIAQWYLDRRFSPEGPTGLVYAVPELPPSHSADSVVAVLDAAVAALRPGRSKPTSSPVWDTPDDPWAILDPPLTAPTLTALQDTSTVSDSLLDLPAFPDQGHSPEAASAFQGSLIDIPDLPEVPVVKSSSTSVDELLLSPCPDPASLSAPLLPASLDRESDPCPNHLSPVPDIRGPLFRNERLQSEPQVRRKAGARDLKSRAVTLPQIAVIPPEPTPTSLQIGSPIVGPSMAPKALSRDSLKLHIPSVVNPDGLPPSLKSRGTSSGLSPGPDAEIDCLISAVDVVKENFRTRLDPLEPDLGRFSCDVSSAVWRGSSRSRQRASQGNKSSNGITPSSQSRPFPSDMASTSQPSPTTTTTTKPPAAPSHSSIKKNDSMRDKGTEQGSSQTDESLRRALTMRPLPPLPLAPEPMPARHHELENHPVSNATLKALLSAEDASNQSAQRRQERLAHVRLSKRSADAVQDFSEFTHRSFFHSPQEVRSQSDGTLWPQAPSQTRAADPSCGQPRAASQSDLERRKRKGKGIVFVDGGLYKVSH